MRIARSNRMIHSHGHGCHHCNGCPACGQHLCFVCLLPHGTLGDRRYRRNPACPHGSSTCESAGIISHLVARGGEDGSEPVMVDSRCASGFAMKR
jgi:hypothetical protein